MTVGFVTTIFVRSAVRFPGGHFERTRRVYKDNFLRGKKMLKEQQSEINHIKKNSFLVKYQYIFSIFFLIIFYYKIGLTFAFLDDYTHLWIFRGESSTISSISGMIQGGRLLYGILLKFLFSNSYYIENLKYLRIIAVVGVWLGTIVLFRYLIWLKWNHLNAFIISLLFATLPSFSLYIGWASTCLVPWAFLFALLSAICAIKIIEHPSLKVRYLIFTLVVILMQCSLSIYQSSGTAYFLPVFILILTNPKMPRNQLFILMGIFAFSLVVYMLHYKLTLLFMDLSKLERASIDPKIIQKFIYFYYKDLKQIMSYNIISGEKLVLRGLRFSGYAVLLLFFFQKLRDTISGKMLFWNFLFILTILPLTNLPRIASTEVWTCYRSLGVTAVCMLIITCYMIEQLKNKYIQHIVTIAFAIVMTVAGYYNINNRFINYQVNEYNKVSKAASALIKKKPDEIIIIRPSWSAHTDKVFADEYGLPSNTAAWVSVPFMNLLVEKETGQVSMVNNPLNGIRSNQIKLQVYNHGEPYQNKEQHPIIDIQEIIRAGNTVGK